LLALVVALSVAASAQDQHPLVGTWRLISQKSIVEGEAPQNVFGDNPKGYLIATREGPLMALFTAEKRQGGMGDTERAALHKSIAAVSGEYRVEDSTFVIAVDVSWNESWIGTAGGSVQDRRKCASCRRLCGRGPVALDEAERMLRTFAAMEKNG
jgi:Lipocalin-like domain